MKNKETKKIERELAEKALELEKKLLSKLPEKNKTENNGEAVASAETVASAENSTSEKSEADNSLQDPEKAEDAVEVEAVAYDEVEPEVASKAKKVSVFARSRKRGKGVDGSDLKEYCDFIEATAEKLNAHSFRIAGSNGEKRGARMLRELTQTSLNSYSRLEPFDSRMLRGRGSIVILGIFYAVCLILYLISFAAKGAGGSVFTALVLAMFLIGSAVIISLWLGFPLFKKLYPKKISYNVVSVVEPIDEVKRTLVVSCNYDSAFGNNFKPKKNYMPWFLAYSFASLALFAVFCVLKLSLPQTPASVISLTVSAAVLSGFGAAVLSGYVSLFKSKADENNGLGAATALAAVKYLDDQDLIPNDLRIVFAAFAADNAGHGGAEEFVKSHLDDGLLKNPSVLNFGELFDGTLTAAAGDALRAQSFDEKLLELVTDAAAEQDVVSDRFSGALNAVYGFASTPFAKKNIPAVTVLSKNMSVNPLTEKSEKDVCRENIENYFKVAVLTIEKYIGD